MPKGRNFPVLTSANRKMKGYRKEVAAAAVRAMHEQKLKRIDRPAAVWVIVGFYLKRAKSAPKVSMSPTTRPDLDKLTRAVLDALTGTVFEDDSQVVQIRVWKYYGAPERTDIFVEAMRDRWE